MNEILLVYGSGGHNEQMRRLHKCLSSAQSPALFFSIVDNDVRHIVTKEHIVLHPVSDKYSFFKTLVTFLKNFSCNYKLISKIFNKHNFKCVISTGPGVAILPMLISKIHGVPIIYFESWSRFETRSITGVFAYYIATHYLVQNNELEIKYKKSKYFGRL